MSAGYDCPVCGRPWPVASLAQLCKHNPNHTSR
jgi:hypothetical protein